VGTRLAKADGTRLRLRFSTCCRCALVYFPALPACLALLPMAARRAAQRTLTRVHPRRALAYAATLTHLLSPSPPPPPPVSPARARAAWRCTGTWRAAPPLAHPTRGRDALYRSHPASACPAHRTCCATARHPAGVAHPSRTLHHRAGGITLPCLPLRQPHGGEGPRSPFALLPLPRIAPPPHCIPLPTRSALSLCLVTTPAGVPALTFCSLTRISYAHQHHIPLPPFAATPAAPPLQRPTAPRRFHLPTTPACNDRFQRSPHHLPTPPLLLPRRASYFCHLPPPGALCRLRSGRTRIRTHLLLRRNVCLRHQYQ